MLPPIRSSDPLNSTVVAKAGTVTSSVDACLLMYTVYGSLSGKRIFARIVSSECCSLTPVAVVATL